MVKSRWIRPLKSTKSTSALTGTPARLKDISGRGAQNKYNMKHIKTHLLFAAFIISMMTNFFLAVKVNHPKEDTLLAEEAVAVAEPDTLSDWNIFTLALMKVESEYNNDAVSSVGARGYFQITPIYVREVNRIHKTNFTFDQVTNFDKAYEIFDLMQKAHNPDYDMDRALELHNGKHAWYNRRVYKEMKLIRQYEEMRNKIKSI